MQYKWLNKKDNKKIIVFFNGWGMNEEVVSNLQYEDYDVLTFFDYRSIEIPDFDFSQYDEKILIAWSMGVFVCNCFYDFFNDFNKYIAVNGTQKPIDDNYGINENIYNLMIENFNETTVSRFMKKMTLNDNLSDYKSRTDEELKEELISIRNIKPEKYLDFDKIIVSLKDRVIPAKNQLNYWKTQLKHPEELSLPHYIFDNYNKWSELI